MPDLVLSTGRAPVPPPPFDASSSVEGDFAPPLSKAVIDAPPAVPKVLSSGLTPKAPPTFDTASANAAAWNFPLDEKKASAVAAVAAPRPSPLPSVPKVLSTGLKPQPPAAFSEGETGEAPQDWVPPLSASAAPAAS